MRVTHMIIGALAVVTTVGVVQAQRSDSREQTERDRERIAVARIADNVWQFGADADDAVLGISTSSSGDRDTLGLLVTSVTPGSPADKAGIEEGNRIAAVNGVNLKLASADAGERDMQGMTTRRLVREMGKVKAGDEVELSLWQQGRYATVKVKTIAREDLPGRERVTRDEMDERAVVGLTLQPTGSVRDSLGPMVVSVAKDGPAEKAGIVEGDRIASINSTSLAVAPADAEDGYVSSAKVNRFSRVLRDVKAGDAVELRVYSGGAMKTVRVTTGKSEDVYGERSGNFMIFRGGDGVSIAPMAPMPPVPPTPMVRVLPRIYMDGGTIHEMESARVRATEQVRAAMLRAQEALERARVVGRRTVVM